jgi:hypothetical protein
MRESRGVWQAQSAAQEKVNQHGHYALVGQAQKRFIRECFSADFQRWLGAELMLGRGKYLVADRQTGEVCGRN